VLLTVYCVIFGGVNSGPAACTAGPDRGEFTFLIHGRMCPSILELNMTNNEIKLELLDWYVIITKQN
jgi:hypothetical protein